MEVTHLLRDTPVVRTLSWVKQLLDRDEIESCKMYVYIGRVVGCLTGLAPALYVLLVVSTPQ